MNLEIGSSVEALDDAIAGKVVDIQGEQITVLTDEGFPIVYHIKEIVQIPTDEVISIDENSVMAALQEKATPKPKKSLKRSAKENNQKALEVDLHIHVLVESTKNMTNFDMLNLQLDTAKHQLDFAIQKRIQRVVFIHGVGQGVLRAELETLFRRYDDRLRYYDADYKKYGLGATEVYIAQH